MKTKASLFAILILVLSACAPSLKAVVVTVEPVLKKTTHTSNESAAVEVNLPEIEVGGFSYTKPEPTYGIDEFLNFQFTIKANLSLDAQFKKPTPDSPTGYTLEKLKAGKYQIRWAILAAEAENLIDLKGHVIASGMTEVSVHNAGNAITFPIEFSTENQRAISHTSILVVRVLPQSAKQEAFSETLFKSRILIPEKASSTFEAFNPKAGADFFDLVNTQAINDKHKSDTELLRQSDKQFVARTELLRIINLNSDSDLSKLEQDLIYPRAKFPQFKNEPARPLGMTRAELKRALVSTTSNRTWSQQLCMYWFYQLLPIYETKTNKPLFHTFPNTQTGATQYNISQNCAYKAQNSLLDVFQIQTIYFMKNPKLQKIARTSLQQFQISSDFSTSDGNDESTEWNWSTSLGFKIPIHKLASVDVGAKYGQSVSHSRGTDRSNSLSAGSEMTMESLKMDLRAEKVEKCVVIRLDPKVYNGNRGSFDKYLTKDLEPQTKIDALRKGLMICDGEQSEQKINLSEDFFIVNQKGAEQVLDSNSNLGHPFFAVIRGKTELNRFLTYLKTKIQMPDQPKAEDFATTLEDLFIVKLSSYPSQLMK